MFLGTPFAFLFTGNYILNLGADIIVFGYDAFSAYDAQAGIRIEDNAGGMSPYWEKGRTDSGSMEWQGKLRNILSPAGATSSLFEYSWVEISDNTGSKVPDTKSTPVAASTWAGCETSPTWYAQLTTSGDCIWIIDITVREIADTANTDTARVEMRVEATP